jgi:hypothetical protein
MQDKKIIVIVDIDLGALVVTFTVFYVKGVEVKVF